VRGERFSGGHFEQEVNKESCKVLFSHPKAINNLRSIYTRGGSNSLQ